VEKVDLPTDQKVKNIIFMIGDGMSLAHMYSAWTANGGKLHIDNCNYVGLQKTYCANKLITDSGASITAMITGEKTNYHSLSYSKDGKPLKVITDYLQEDGKATGIISVCRLTDATPAAFAAKNITRDSVFDIALDFADSKLDFICGGGRKYFKTQRKDGKNIVSMFKKRTYATPTSVDELENCKSDKVFAVLAENDIPKPKERGDYLSKVSLKALEILSKDQDGFFLMIEGSQIDDYGHFNDINLLMQEVLDFDKCVGAVLQWLKTHPNTLLVVTADHETGGLTLVDGEIKKNEIKSHFSTRSHSGVMVPVYAFGAGAEKFTGIYENSDIFHKMMAALEVSKQ
jgi:alkaline phosphatase